MSTPTIGRDASQISYDDLTALISSGQPINDPNYGSLTGYRVEQLLGTTGQGVTAYALRNANGDIVIAVRGTNDASDWLDNVGNLGWRQWQEIKANVNNYLNRRFSR